MGQATAGLPKPMLPVAGKPLLEHQLEWLKTSGFSEVTLCLGHKAEAVQGYFGDGSRWGLKLRYQVEAAPRGTAGCIRDLAPQGDLLVVYGDLYPDLELDPFLAFHSLHPEAAASLLLLETDHPQDSDLAKLDGDRVVEIYRGGEGNLGLSAVWIVRPPLLALAPAGAPSDFGRDIFPAALSRGMMIAGCVMKGVLADVGTPERLARLEAALRPS
jgi:mannose-1-phosphate guanylyltransferase / phosphomannomutase